jgi:2-dehydropantoate 2-reductase
MMLLIGAGAVGSVLATYLGAAGREPLRLYARDKDRAALEAVPALRVDDVDGHTLCTAPRPALAPDLDLAGIDYLLLCVKYAALEKLLDQLPPIPPSCTVVSTLNGIEPLRLLRRRLPQARILPMTIMYNAQLLGPLHGQLTTRPIVIIGGDDARLAAAFAGSGLRVQHARGEAAVWGKLLINLANAVCALTHTTFKDLFTQPDLRRAYVAVLDEAVGLLESVGIPYQLPMPLPYRGYRWMLLNGGPLPWWIAQLRNGVRAGSYPSMVADVEQGRVTEVEQLNGEIVRQGAAHGRPTPVARRIVALVEDLKGTKPPAYLTPEQLRQQLDSAAG